MAIPDHETMAEDVKRRLDVLSDADHMIVDWLVEVWDYSLEDAVDMVDKGAYGDYGFCHSDCWFYGWQGSCAACPYSRSHS